jgi:hypothetical protein
VGGRWKRRWRLWSWPSARRRSSVAGVAAAVAARPSPAWPLPSAPAWGGETGRGLGERHGGDWVRRRLTNREGRKEEEACGDWARVFTGVPLIYARGEKERMAEIRSES